MKEGYLKQQLTNIIFVSRLVIIFSLILLYFLGGLTEDELRQVSFIILPLSCVYFALILKFSFRQKRYVVEGKTVSSGYALFCRLFLLALYSTEFLVILVKALFNSLSPDVFYSILFIPELALGIYAGLYLPDIFALNTSDSNRHE